MGQTAKQKNSFELGRYGKYVKRREMDWKKSSEAVSADSEIFD